MNDTPPEIEEKMRQLFQRKTPQERLEMGCSLYDFSKDLVLHAIFEESPKILPADLRKELFLRFYAGDFDPPKKLKILAFLKS